MANRFNLTAQMQLQAPTNVPRIANQISRQLNGISADVKINANPRQMAAANSQMQGLSKATQQSANNMGNLNRSLSEAARRFSVITIATGSLLALSRSIKNAFGEAIEFERQLIKIEQVTGKNVKQLSGLTKEITKLSTSLGASSKDLLGISRILTQAGFEVTKVKSALDILAKTTLGATFENIEDTTEGAVAALRQFGDEAKRVGGDIKFLERTMDAINSVSKNFAVESGDLITVIRRVGGVFEAAGGSVNELIALFTSVRSTTRETAETIATGLRTIFTRLQRTDTVDQLQQLGIELRNSKGEFVGAFEAVSRLSAGLSSLNPRDFRFSEIVESLGGFRQIGKVIPLIRQFTVAQDALRIAQESSGSVAKDAATAQQTLSVQFDKTKEKFDALVRNLADSTGFQTMARFVLKLADAFTKMVDALEPLLPLLLPLMGLKLGRALAPGIAALAGASRFTKRNEGGPIRKFATGGVVPGTGNRDTVPAMLTPGEFVIRKSSVKKLGAETLAQMNNNRYAKGGVAGFKSAFARNNTYRGKKNTSKGADEPFQSGVNQFTARDTVEAEITRKSLDVSNEIKKAYKGDKAEQLKFARKFNSEKSNPKIQGETFERLLRKSKTLGGSSSAYGGSAPLDGTFGSRFAEVKRSNVSKNVLLDKRLRHEQSLNKLQGQRLTSRGADNISLTGLTELSAASGSVPLKQFQKKNAGGAIKSILQTNKVGSATLDLGGDSDLPLGKILNSEVTNSRYLKGNNFAQNTGAVSKYLKSQGKSAVPSYTLKRASLNQKTSDKFTNELLNQLGSAIDGASQTLGMDLIGKPVSASSSAKAAIRSKFAGEGGVVGDLFETTLNTIANSGGFAPANIQQPFDFPNGLTGPAADNFTGALPSSFVDARKVQGKPSKDAPDFRRKVISQLALEIAGSSFAKSPVKKKSKGGGIGTDTVPALLTPGEFVINKDAAKRIGQANLDSMNKKGVSKFATGGTVGGQKIQRLNRGGFGDDSGGRILPINIDTAPFEAQLSTLVSKLDQLGISVDVNSQEFRDGLGQAGGNLERYAQTLKSKANEAATREALSGEVGPNEGGIGLGIKSESISDVMSKPLAEKVALTTQGNKIDKDINKRKSKLGSTLQTRINDNSLSSKIQGELQKEMTIEKSQLQESDPSKPPNVANAQDSTAADSAQQQSRIKSVQRIQGVAQSAQNFVFLAGSATALVSQFTSLSDSTKKAITQTSAFAATVVGGIGTIVDLGASIAVGIMARKAEAAASLEVIAAKRLEAAQGGTESLKKFDAAQEASKNVGGGLTKLLGPLAAAAAAIAAVALVLNFYGNKARAEAEELGQANDEYIKKIAEGGNFKAALRTGVSKQIAKAEEAESYSLTSGSAITGMAVGGGVAAGLAGTIAAFTALGAFAGPVGIAAGVVVGSLVGLGIAFRGATAAQEAARKKREEEIASLNAVIGSYADLLTAQNKFKAALSDIDLAQGLTAEQRVSRRVSAQSEFQRVSSRADRAGGKYARDTLLALSADRGKSISDLSEDDFEKGSLQSQQFKFATEQRSEGIEAASLGAVEARKTLSEASALSIGGGGQTFQGLTSGVGDFAKAFKNTQSAIQEEFKLKRISNQLELQGIRNQQKENIDSEKMALLKQQELALNSKITEGKTREKQQLADLDTGVKNQIASANEAAAAELQLAAAAEESAQRLSSILDFGNALANLDKDVDKFGRSVSDFSSISSGGIKDFSFDNILGLKDLKRTGNAKEFSRDLNSLVSDLPADMQKQGRAMVNSVERTAFLLQKGQLAVSKITFRPTEGQIGVKETRQLIKAAGLDPDAIPKNMFGQIQKGLMEKFKDGINAKEFNEIFQPFIEEGNSAAKELEKINTIRNTEIKTYERQVDNLIKLRQNEIDNRLKSFDITKKANEIRRNALGQEQSVGSIIKERREESRIRLSGTGARAGSLESIIGTRNNAVSRLQASFRRGANNTAEAKQETAIQKNLQKIIETTTSELKFFAGTVTELAQQEIKLIEAQKERNEAEKAAKRGLIQDLVVGGQDERASIGRTLFNVEKAFRSGTLQNQRPEDRSAIVSMLDRFEDVFLSGAGMTGGQLRDLLIQQDAMRMGLPPEVAQALFSENNIQRDLIKSTDNLSMVMNLLARATLQTNEVNRARVNPFLAGQQNKQFGGVIYRNEGGSIFQPKGTDTVPAMLTPGEFVIRKSAVDKVGVGTLNSINQGKPLYRADGGEVPSVNYLRFGGVASYGAGNTTASNKAVKEYKAKTKREIEGYKRLVGKYGAGPARDMMTRPSVDQLNPETINYMNGVVPATPKQVVNASRKDSLIERDKFLDRKGLSDVREYKEGRFQKKDKSSILDEKALKYFNNLHENILKGNAVFPYSPEDLDRANYTESGVGKIKEAYLKALTRTAIEFPSYSKEIQEKYQAAFEKAASYNLPSGNIKISKSDHWLSSFSIGKGTFEKVRQGFDPTKIESDQGVDFAQNSKAKQQAAKEKDLADVKAKLLLSQRKAQYNKRMKQQAEDRAEENTRLRKLEEKKIRDDQTRADKAVAESKAQSLKAGTTETSERYVGGGIHLSKTTKYPGVRKDPSTGQVMSSSGKTFDDLMADKAELARNRKKRNDDLMAGDPSRPDEIPGNELAQQQMERDQADHDAKMAQIARSAQAQAEGSLVGAGTLQYKVGDQVKSIQAELMSTYYKGAQEPRVAGANFKFYSKEAQQIKQAGIGIERIASWNGAGGSDLTEAIDERRLAQMQAAESGAAAKIIERFSKDKDKPFLHNGQLRLERINAETNELVGTYYRDLASLDDIQKHNYMIKAKQAGASNKVLKLINPSAFPAAEKPKIVGPSAEEQARRDAFNDGRNNRFISPDVESKGIKNPSGKPATKKTRGDGQNRDEYQRKKALEKQAARGDKQRNNPQQQAQQQFNERRNQFLDMMLRDGFDKMSMEHQNNYLYSKDPAGYGRLRSNRERSFQLTNALTQLYNHKRNMAEQSDDPIYKALGGSINGGMDSVPAMLTPGEFVMSREAVAKHGVGYMKNLNMGKATGFRRGGVVGTGNVQYKANGGEVNGSGGMMIDPSLLSETLNGFSAAFSEQMSTITKSMDGIANQLQGIAESFGSLTMFHTFAGELSMNVNISNKDAIIAAVSDGLLPMIANQIQAQIDASANTFNAGG